MHFLLQIDNDTSSDVHKINLVEKSHKISDKDRRNTTFHGTKIKKDAEDQIIWQVDHAALSLQLMKTTMRYERHHCRHAVGVTAVQSRQFVQALLMPQHHCCALRMVDTLDQANDLL